MCSCTGQNIVGGSRYKSYIYQQWPILLYITIDIRGNTQSYLGSPLEEKLLIQNEVVYELISVEYYDGSHITASIKHTEIWHNYDGMKSPTITPRIHPLTFFDGIVQVCGLYYKICE